MLGAVSSPSKSGISQSAAPVVTLMRGRSNSVMLPLAQLTANASMTAAASSSGMVSAWGAAWFLTSSCDMVSPFQAFRLLSL